MFAGHGAGERPWWCDVLVPLRPRSCRCMEVLRLGHGPSLRMTRRSVGAALSAGQERLRIWVVPLDQFPRGFARLMCPQCVPSAFLKPFRRVRSRRCVGPTSPVRCRGESMDERLVVRVCELPRLLGLRRDISATAAGFRRLWRRCMGVEPTRDLAQTPHWF